MDTCMNCGQSITKAEWYSLTHLVAPVTGAPNVTANVQEGLEELFQSRVPVSELDGICERCFHLLSVAISMRRTSTDALEQFISMSSNVHIKNLDTPLLYDHLNTEINTKLILQDGVDWYSVIADAPRNNVVCYGSSLAIEYINSIQGQINQFFTFCSEKVASQKDKDGKEIENTIEKSSKSNLQDGSKPFNKTDPSDSTKEDSGHKMSENILPSQQTVTQQEPSDKVPPSYNTVCSLTPTDTGVESHKTVIHTEQSDKSIQDLNTVKQTDKALESKTTVTSLEQSDKGLSSKKTVAFIAKSNKSITNKKTFRFSEQPCKPDNEGVTTFNEKRFEENLPENKEPGLGDMVENNNTKTNEESKDKDSNSNQQYSAKPYLEVESPFREKSNSELENLSTERYNQENSHLPKTDNKMKEQNMEKSVSIESLSVQSLTLSSDSLSYDLLSSKMYFNDNLEGSFNSVNDDLNEEIISQMYRNDDLNGADVISEEGVELALTAYKLDKPKNVTHDQEKIPIENSNGCNETNQTESAVTDKICQDSMETLPSPKMTNYDLELEEIDSPESFHDDSKYSESELNDHDDPTYTEEKDDSKYCKSELNDHDDPNYSKEEDDLKYSKSELNEHDDANYSKEKDDSKYSKSELNDHDDPNYSQAKDDSTYCELETNCSDNLKYLELELYDEETVIFDIEDDGSHSCNMPVNQERVDTSEQIKKTLNISNDKIAAGYGEKKGTNTESCLGDEKHKNTENLFSHEHSEVEKEFITVDKTSNIIQESEERVDEISKEKQAVRENLPLSRSMLNENENPEVLDKNDKRLDETEKTIIDETEESSDKNDKKLNENSEVLDENDKNLDETEESLDKKDEKSNEKDQPVDENNGTLKKMNLTENGDNIRSDETYLILNESNVNLDQIDLKENECSKKLDKKNKTIDEEKLKEIQSNFNDPVEDIQCNLSEMEKCKNNGSVIIIKESEAEKAASSCFLTKDVAIGNMKTIKPNESAKKHDEIEENTKKGNETEKSLESNKSIQSPDLYKRAIEKVSEAVKLRQRKNSDHDGSTEKHLETLEKSKSAVESYRKIIIENKSKNIDQSDCCSPSNDLGNGNVDGQKTDTMYAFESPVLDKYIAENTLQLANALSVSPKMGRTNSNLGKNEEKFARIGRIMENVRARNSGKTPSYKLQKQKFEDALEHGSNKKDDGKNKNLEKTPEKSTIEKLKSVSSSGGKAAKVLLKDDATVALKDMPRDKSLTHLKKSNGKKSMTFADALNSTDTSLVNNNKNINNREQSASKSRKSIQFHTEKNSEKHSSHSRTTQKDDIKKSLNKTSNETDSALICKLKMDNAPNNKNEKRSRGKDKTDSSKSHSKTRKSGWSLKVSIKDPPKIQTRHSSTKKSHAGDQSESSENVEKHPDQSPEVCFENMNSAFYSRNIKRKEKLLDKDTSDVQSKPEDVGILTKEILMNLQPVIHLVRLSDEEIGRFVSKPASVLPLKEKSDALTKKSDIHSREKLNAPTKKSDIHSRKKSNAPTKKSDIQSRDEEINQFVSKPSSVLPSTEISNALPSKPSPVLPSKEKSDALTKKLDIQSRDEEINQFVSKPSSVLPSKETSNAPTKKSDIQSRDQPDYSGINKIQVTDTNLIGGEVVMEAVQNKDNVKQSRTKKTDSNNKESKTNEMSEKQKSMDTSVKPCRTKTEVPKSVKKGNENKQGKKSCDKNKTSPADIYVFTDEDDETVISFPEDDTYTEMSFTDEGVDLDPTFQDDDDDDENIDLLVTRKETIKDPLSVGEKTIIVNTLSVEEKRTAISSDSDLWNKKSEDYELCIRKKTCRNITEHIHGEIGENIEDTSSKTISVTEPESVKDISVTETNSVNNVPVSQNKREGQNNDKNSKNKRKQKKGDKEKHNKSEQSAGNDMLHSDVLKVTKKAQISNRKDEDSENFVEHSVLENNKSGDKNSSTNASSIKDTDKKCPSDEQVVMRKDRDLESFKNAHEEIVEKIGMGTSSMREKSIRKGKSSSKKATSVERSDFSTSTESNIENAVNKNDLDLLLTVKEKEIESVSVNDIDGQKVVNVDIPCNGQDDDLEKHSKDETVTLNGSSVNDVHYHSAVENETTKFESQEKRTQNSFTCVDRNMMDQEGSASDKNKTLRESLLTEEISDEELSVLNETSYVCDTCKKEFIDESAYQYHRFNKRCESRETCAKDNLLSTDEQVTQLTNTEKDQTISTGIETANLRKEQTISTGIERANSGKEHTISSGIETANSGKEHTISTEIETANSDKGQTVKSGKSLQEKQIANSTVIETANSGKEQTTNSGKEQTANKGLEQTVISDKEQTVKSGKSLKEKQKSKRNKTKPELQNKEKNTHQEKTLEELESEKKKIERNEEQNENTESDDHRNSKKDLVISKTFGIHENSTSSEYGKSKKDIATPKNFGILKSSRWIEQHLNTNSTLSDSDTMSAGNDSPCEIKSRDNLTETEEASSHTNSAITRATKDRSRKKRQTSVKESDDMIQDQSSMHATRQRTRDRSSHNNLQSKNTHEKQTEFEKSISTDIRLGFSSAKRGRKQGSYGNRLRQGSKMPIIYQSSDTDDQESNNKREKTYSKKGKTKSQTELELEKGDLYDIALQKPKQSRKRRRDNRSMDNRSMSDYTEGMKEQDEIQEKSIKLKIDSKNSKRKHSESSDIESHQSESMINDKSFHSDNPTNEAEGFVDTNENRCLHSNNNESVTIETNENRRLHSNNNESVTIETNENRSLHSNDNESVTIETNDKNKSTTKVKEFEKSSEVGKKKKSRIKKGRELIGVGAVGKKDYGNLFDNIVFDSGLDNADFESVDKNKEVDKSESLTRGDSSHKSKSGFASCMMESKDTTERKKQDISSDKNNSEDLSSVPSMKTIKNSPKMDQLDDEDDALPFNDETDISTEIVQKVEYINMPSVIEPQFDLEYNDMIEESKYFTKTENTADNSLNSGESNTIDRHHTENKMSLAGLLMAKVENMPESSNFQIENRNDTQNGSGSHGTCVITSHVVDNHLPVSKFDDSLLNPESTLSSHRGGLNQQMYTSSTNKNSNVQKSKEIISSNLTYLDVNMAIPGMDKTNIFASSGKGIDNSNLDFPFKRPTHVPEKRIISPKDDESRSNLNQHVTKECSTIKGSIIQAVFGSPSPPKKRNVSFINMTSKKARTLEKQRRETENVTNNKKQNVPFLFPSLFKKKKTKIKECDKSKDNVELNPLTGPSPAEALQLDRTHNSSFKEFQTSIECDKTKNIVELNPLTGPSPAKALKLDSKQNSSFEELKTSAPTIGHFDSGFDIDQHLNYNNQNASGNNQTISYKKPENTACIHVDEPFQLTDILNYDSIRNNSYAVNSAIRNNLSNRGRGVASKGKKIMHAKFNVNDVIEIDDLDKDDSHADIILDGIETSALPESLNLQHDFSIGPSSQLQQDTTLNLASENFPFQNWQNGTFGNNICEIDGNPSLRSKPTHEMDNLLLNSNKELIVSLHKLTDREIHNQGHRELVPNSNIPSLTPWHCALCQECYRLRDELIQHIVNIHQITHDEERLKHYIRCVKETGSTENRKIMKLEQGNVGHDHNHPSHVQTHIFGSNFEKSSSDFGKIPQKPMFQSTLTPQPTPSLTNSDFSSKINTENGRLTEQHESVPATLKKESPVSKKDEHSWKCMICGITFLLKIDVIQHVKMKHKGVSSNTVSYTQFPVPSSTSLQTLQSSSVEIPTTQNVAPMQDHSNKMSMTQPLLPTYEYPVTSVEIPLKQPKPDIMSYPNTSIQLPVTQSIPAIEDYPLSSTIDLTMIQSMTNMPVSQDYPWPSVEMPNTQQPATQDCSITLVETPLQLPNTLQPATQDCSINLDEIPLQQPISSNQAMFGTSQNGSSDTDSTSTTGNMANNFPSAQTYHAPRRVIKQKKEEKKKTKLKETSEILIISSKTDSLPDGLFQVPMDKPEPMKSILSVKWHCKLCPNWYRLRKCCLQHVQKEHNIRGNWARFYFHNSQQVTHHPSFEICTGPHVDMKASEFCIVCGRSYSNANEMLRHIRRNHPYVPEVHRAECIQNKRQSYRIIVACDIFKDLHVYIIGKNSARLVEKDFFAELFDGCLDGNYGTEFKESDIAVATQMKRILYECGMINLHPSVMDRLKGISHNFDLYKIKFQEDFQWDRTKQQSSSDSEQSEQVVMEICDKEEDGDAPNDVVVADVHVVSLNKCHKCNITFPDRISLDQHNLTHKIQVRFTCRLCNKNFPKLFFLLQHLEIKHDQKQPGYFQFVLEHEHLIEDDLEMDKDPTLTLDETDSETEMSTSASRTSLEIDTTKGDLKHFNEDDQELDEDDIETSESRSCYVCGKIFETRVAIFTHLKEKHKIHNRKCLTCNKSYASKIELQKHFSEVHNTDFMFDFSEQLFRCYICDLVLESRKELIEHLPQHNSATYSCNLCDMTYTSGSSLRFHKRTVHWNLEGTRSCKICNNKIFTNMKAYESHMLNHFYDYLGPMKCSECNITIKNKKLYKQHVASHGLSLICEHCGKICLDQNALRHHVITHNLTETCHICGKKLNKYSIKNHMVKVHGEKLKVACEICGKQVNQSYMSLHIEEVHNKNKEVAARKKHCDICGKTFKRPGLLKTHMVVHTGEKPFECKVCGRCFGHKTALNTHYLTHKGFKPHQCQFCKESFWLISKCKSHMRKEHGYIDPILKHECEFCEKRFKHISGLRQHQDENHTDEVQGPKFYPCRTCKKEFRYRKSLREHIAICSQEAEPGNVYGRELSETNTAIQNVMNVNIDQGEIIQTFCDLTQNELHTNLNGVQAHVGNVDSQPQVIIEQEGDVTYQTIYIQSDDLTNQGPVYVQDLGNQEQILLHDGGQEGEIIVALPDNCGEYNVDFLSGNGQVVHDGEISYAEVVVQDQ